MIDFGQIGFTEAQIDMLGVAESFCRDKSPISKVRSLIEDAQGYDAEIWAEIGALGWLAIAIPESYGGVGLSLTEVVPVVEQMGRRMMHTPFVATTLAAQAVMSAGTEAHKSEILPAIAGGAAATVALSEANGDWDLRNIEATATRQADGYRLSGTKTFVADLPSAQWVIANVKIDGAVVLVIIPKASISDDAMRREVLIDQTKRTYELNLDGVVIKAADVLDPQETQAALDHIHLAANLLGAAELTGACQACIDYTVDYLKTRKQFGKLIGSYQALKHPIVDAFVDYQKSRSLLYTAAFSFADAGPKNDKTAEISTRMAKVQGDKALSFAADRSIQFHGGFGFTYDCDAQLYRRRAIFLASQYGDGAYHKKKLADLIL